MMLDGDEGCCTNIGNVSFSFSTMDDMLVVVIPPQKFWVREVKRQVR